MTKLIIILTCLCISVYCSGQKHTAKAKKSECCTGKYAYGQWDTLDIKKLGAEYLRLKHKKCEDCSSSAAPFNDIMEALGKRLNGKTEKEITKIMGKPDTIIEHKHIYFWRDMHDYLFFIYSDGKGTSQWYHAWE